MGTLFHMASLQAASYDCGKAAGYAETAICDDVELSELDDNLSASYQATYADSTTKRRRQLKLDQRKWLGQRNACLDRACLKSAYETRLSELTIDSECPLARCTRFAESGPSRQLWISAQKGDLGDARTALRNAADPNVCGSSYERPLHLAVNRRDLALVRELLRVKANPNYMNCPGNTPLILAAYNNDVEISTLLLSAGADPELGGDISPLRMAAFHGHIETLKTLLAHGANPNAVRSDTTPLVAAATNGHVEAVQLLLEAGADPKFQDSAGGTALFDAVGGFRVVPPTAEEQDRTLRIVRLLVQYGADVNATTAGQSPLQRARALNEAAIVDFLTEVGAKVVLPQSSPSERRLTSRSKGAATAALPLLRPPERGRCRAKISSAYLAG